MKPVFATSNENKLREAAEILGVDLDRADMDVPEIRSLDFGEVAAAKALAAREALGAAIMLVHLTAKRRAAKGGGA